MTDGAGIGDFQGLADGGVDEAERVAADIHVADRLGDSRHMAGHTLAAHAVRKMMGMGGK